MDNTLTDQVGSSVRPGIISLLTKLTKDKHILVLYTNSTKMRALTILRDHKLREFFHEVYCREDYDPANKSIPKDIARFKEIF